MLRDIAEAMTELIMESLLRRNSVLPLMKRDAATVYQRFAFLRASLWRALRMPSCTSPIARTAWVEVNGAIPANPSQPRHLSPDNWRDPGPSWQYRSGVVVTLPTRLEVVRTRRRLIRNPTASSALPATMAPLVQTSASTAEKGAMLQRPQEMQDVLDRLDSYLTMTNFPGCRRSLASRRETQSSA